MLDSDTIGALSGFLSFGAIGLAGLMLVLVIIALMVSNPTEAKERILKRFMYVGAFCFVAALAAQVYLQVQAPGAPDEFGITLEVAPHDFGTTSRFPPPIIRVGGVAVDRASPIPINADATVVVDLLDGVDLFERAAQTVETQTVRLEEAEEIVAAQNAALEQAQAATVRLSNEVMQLQTDVTAAPRVNSLSRELDTLSNDIGRGIRLLP